MRVIHTKQLYASFMLWDIKILALKNYFGDPPETRVH